MQKEGRIKTMTTSGITEESTGKKALLAIRKHFDQVSAVTFIQVAARLAFFALVLFPGILGENTPRWVAWLCAAAIYILGIIPLRFWAKEKMRRLFYSHHVSGYNKNPYGKWLKTGLASCIWSLAECTSSKINMKRH